MLENKGRNPSIEKLIELEKTARLEGSGIEYDSLLGLWKFKSVWKQGSDKEDLKKKLRQSKTKIDVLKIACDILS